MSGLFRTTIVIWSEFDGGEVELEDLARDATSGGSYCSKQDSVFIEDPYSDADPPSQEFFEMEEES
jgi:hypothetical protein